MPIREPGVIVQITGQPLPPPNPPTRYGVANYVFAKDGPFKTRAILNSVFPKPFNDIVQGPTLNDISFLKTIVPVYGQVLPNLGHKKALALLALPPNINTVVPGFYNSTNNQVNPPYEKLFVLPLWLDGPPKYMAKFTYSGVTLNLPSSGTYALHNNASRITRIKIGGEEFYSVPNLLTATSLAPQDTNIQEIDFRRFNSIAYGSIPSTISSPVTILIYLRMSNSTSYSGNLYIILDIINANSIEVYIYSDGVGSWIDNNDFGAFNITYGINNSNTGTDLFQNDLDLDPTNIVVSLKKSASSLPSNALNIPFDVVYFTSFLGVASLEITNSTPPSTNPYVLRYTEGNTTVRYELSYLPSDTGYYGFLNNDNVEIIEHGALYDSVSTNNYVPVFVSSSQDGIFTEVPFFDPRHDLRIHRARLNLGSIFSSVPSPLPDEAGAVNIQPLANNNYLYIKRYVTYTNADSLYNNWINAWNSFVIYRDTDVRPIKESPVQADLLSDYGGDISYGFTSFIRSHDKFMFKVLGTGDLSNIRIADLHNYVKYYWKVFPLSGFHYIRLQGTSSNGISGCALYERAVFDYQFNAIFGINASLAMSDADFEFTRPEREEFLEDNINCIVMDRNLFLWYFNNNLTEEPRRDDSPLGEECNARFAIRLTKILGVYVERYIGQPNNVVTRSRITSDLTNFIRNFMTNNPSNMVDFKVICDESNNTPNDIANNILNIRVEARFGKSIKYIIIFERVLASL